jgi:hypothetical protein
MKTQKNFDMSIFPLRVRAGDRQTLRAQEKILLLLPWVAVISGPSPATPPWTLRLP